jgi:hypothetical protein
MSGKVSGFDEERGLKVNSDESRTHWAILGLLVGCTALLRFRPEWALAHGPVCVTRMLLHVNCPFCGMTRDFVAMLHGRKPELNPFSGVAAVMVYVVYPILFFWARLKERLSLFHQPAVHRAVAAALIVMFVVNNLSF